MCLNLYVDFVLEYYVDDLLGPFYCLCYTIVSSHDGKEFTLIVKIANLAWPGLTMTLELAGTMFPEHVGLLCAEIIDFTTQINKLYLINAT